MIDELEIKQRKMLLEAEYSYMWSNSYSKKQSAFGSDRTEILKQVKQRLKYYKSLELNIADRKTLLTTLEALEFLKSEKETEIELGGTLSNIESVEYKKVCEDIETIREKLSKLESTM